MKKFCTLLSLLALSHAGFSQTITTSGSIASNIARVGTRSWSIGASSSTASPLNNGLNTTDYLFIRGFDFSSLPPSISVTSLTVTFTRQANLTVTDGEVRLVIAGTVYTAANTNAVSTPGTWPGVATSQTYTFPASAYSTLGAADLQNANFGVAISATRTAGNTSATVENSASITLTYVALAPLILTNFTATKNAEDQVDIRFSTATEENIEHIYVERSTDGLRFEKLFTITPKGARNVYTHYSMTDKAPAIGNNYYRITEVDKNGRWAYYMTKMVTITRSGAAFATYYNGSQVVSSISNIPGQYTVSLHDLSGALLSKREVSMTGKSATVELPSPERTGIYIIVLSGQGMHEARRLAIRK